MDYRRLPHGEQRESFSVLGLGLGGIQKSSDEEIEKTTRLALDNGINFFDLCAGGKNVYAPFGKAIEGRRERVFVQMHFGAVYNDKGDYAWSRDFEQIKSTFEWELETLGTDYADFGLLHCVDEHKDLDELIEAGIVDYLKELKGKGTVRHIGFSSHSPEIANRILDMGIADLMMFSLNPAYDFEKGDDYGIGSLSERSELLRRCQSEGVGISVMKPFHGGKLLDKNSSPFGHALTRFACIQYALDRPAVLTVVPGVRGIDDLNDLLGFDKSSKQERDYSQIGSFTPENLNGNCVYCNHCQPCPAGIDIGMVNKYYDLALAGDKLAHSHYDKLSVKADACLQCGHCDSRCPFKVEQGNRMNEIRIYFS